MMPPKLFIEFPNSGGGIPTPAASRDQCATFTTERADNCVPDDLFYCYLV